MNAPLRKSNKDVVVSGVCSGVAEFFGLDVSHVRILWVIFSFFGSGLFLYIALAIILKPSDVY